MGLIRSGLTVTAYTLLSRVFGFLREIVLANALGVGILTDCFNVAFKLPNFFRRFFAEGAFSAAFIPIFSHKLSSSSKKEIRNFSNQVFTIMTIILISFVILLEILMPQVIEILAPGFHKQSTESFIIAVRLARICMPYLLFISLAALYGGILNSHNKFAAYAFIPVILNIIMIFSLIFGQDKSKTAADALSYGVLVAGLGQYLFMAIILYQKGLLPQFVRPKFNFEVKKLFKNMGPSILSNAIAQLNLVVDTMVCSTIPGAISILYYADRITHLPISLIGTAMATVLLPELAKHTKNGHAKEANLIQYNALKFASLLIFPCAFILLGASEEIIYLIYERGLFTREHTIKTALVILVFGFSVPAYVLTKIYISRFLALQDTKTPFIITLIGLIINIILDLLLVNPFEAAGVAFASTVTSWIIVILYAVVSHKRDIFYHDKKLFQLLLRTIFASFLLYITLLILTKYFNLYLYHDNKVCGLVIFSFIMLVSVMIFIGVASFLGLLDNLKFLKKKKG